MSNWIVSADKAQSDLKLLSHEFLFRPRKKMSAEELDAFSKSHNTKNLVTFIKEWQVENIFPKEKLNDTLKNQKWISGENISLANIAWMPNIHRMNLMD